MTILLSIAIFQALFLVLLLFNKKNKRQSDYLLILVIFIMAAQQGFFLLNFTSMSAAPDWLMLVGAGFPLLFGPLLYFYVQSLIRQEKLGVKELSLHLLPYMLFETLVYVVHFGISGTTASIIDGYVQFQGNLPGFIYWYGAFFAISGFVYPMVCLWLLDRHAKSLPLRFSFTENISLKWLKLLILGALFSFLIGFIAFELIIANRASEPRNAFYIIAIVNTVFIFVLGFFGIRQPNIFIEQKDQRTMPQAKYKHSGLDKEESNRIAQELNEYMKEAKPYLDPKLTLSGLALQLDTSANRLSQVLNSELNQTFYDYVNSFRIQEVQRRIIDPSQAHMTFLGIALDCGFNSKSSFNKLFKEKTGQTPSEYKKSTSL